KVYRVSQQRPAAPEAGDQAAKQVRQQPATRDRGASRINCSESGADCSAHSGGGSTKAAQADGNTAETNRAARGPAVPDHILGSDRTNFNEAGEDQGMNRHAVKRAWSHSGSNDSSSVMGTVPLAQQHQVAREGEQASGNRTSCNEADECSMSN